MNRRCWLCRKEFKDGQLIVPLLQYVTNERRGDFTSSQAEQHVHAEHLKDLTS